MPPAPQEPYAPFRPRMTVVVTRIMAAALILGTAVLIIASPGVPGAGYDVLNTFSMVALLALVLLVMWRHAGVYAIVSPEGIRVRNLVYTTVLAWPEIEGVRFGSGQPWAALDLADGRDVAVMAIQSADGRYAHDEARRLAALVHANHGG